MAKKKATEAGELKERLKSWQADKPDLFKTPDYDADYQHWVQMRHWTAHEAVTLSLGIDPNKVSRDRITSLQPASYAEDSFPVRYSKRFDVLNSHLPELAVQRIDPHYRSLAKLQPGAFVQWAREKRWNLPKELAPLGVKKRKRKVKEPADVLADNQTWQHLESKARQTIEAYPEWCGDKQQPAQAIIKWIEETRKVTLREAEIIKKVLNDWLEKSS